MRNRTVSAIVFFAIAIVRIAFAASAVHSVHNSTATAASRPTDTAMADERQQFSQVPDTIRTSHGSEVAMSSEDDPDSDEPEAEPTPGQPMMVPTPSR